MKIQKLHNKQFSPQHFISIFFPPQITKIIFNPPPPPPKKRGGGATKTQCGPFGLSKLVLLCSLSLVQYIKL